jgi:hypothetical protein
MEVVQSLQNLAHQIFMERWASPTTSVPLASNAQFENSESVSALRRSFTQQ